MKKLLLIIITILLALAVWFSIKENKEAPSSDKPTIKIGVMLPLSGDQAKLGLPVKGAIEIAIQELINKNTKYNYEFIFEDNQFSNSKTTSALSKLININKVDAILDAGSGIGNVTSPITEKNKIIHLNIFASDANVAKGDYNFINWTQPDKQAAKLIDEVTKRNYKNIGLITLNHDGAIAVANIVSDELNKKGISNTTKIFNSGTRDMRIEIKQLNDKGVDLFVLIIFDPELSVFIKQTNELNTKADLTAIESFSFLDDLSVVEGSWYIDAAEGQGEIIEKIKKHNNSNITYGVSNAYDNVMILVQALEAAETKDQAINELLKIKEYQGITGHLTQDKNGIFQSEAIIKKVINGKPIIVKE